MGNKREEGPWGSKGEKERREKSNGSKEERKLKRKIYFQVSNIQIMPNISHLALGIAI